MTGREIKFVDTTLRDGQQSLIATRMHIHEMLPILDKMDEAGFYAAEVWGGATFDSTMRFLNEDPWERLRTFRKHFKKTKLQMLFRGQNMLGYRCYPDDLVEAFLRKAVENGIDIVRVFDALNDVRNIESSVKALKKENAHVQLAISYTVSEVHTVEYFTKLACTFRDMGADSICIKDMAGLLLPNVTYDLVSAIKAECNLPLDIHSHYTSGLAGMSYLKAVEAGADIVDTAMSPFALATSQPATEVMDAAISGFGHTTGLNQEHLKEISHYFKPIRDSAIESGLLSSKILGADITALLFQVPGGMYSNLISQLREQRAESRLEEVLLEIPKVRADMGYPPLVTPSSQIVGTQAVINVLTGERYKIIPKETRDLVRGLYGETPIPIAQDIVKKIIGDEKQFTGRPADALAPMLETAREEIKNYATCEEDILSYALFPQVAKEFFVTRNTQKYGINENLYDSLRNIYPI